MIRERNDSYSKNIKISSVNISSSVVKAVSLSLHTLRKHHLNSSVLYYEEIE